MKDLSEIIEKITEPIYSERGYIEGQILTNWIKIIGQETASYTTPSGVVFFKNQKSGATLKILVSSDKIVEVDFLKENIIERVNIFCGYNAIGHIKIIQFVPSLAENLVKIKDSEAKKVIKNNKNIEFECDQAIINKYSEDIDNINDNSLRRVLTNLSKLL